MPLARLFVPNVAPSIQKISLLCLLYLAFFLCLRSAVEAISNVPRCWDVCASEPLKFETKSWAQTGPPGEVGVVGGGRGGVQCAFTDHFVSAGSRVNASLSSGTMHSGNTIIHEAKQDSLV